MKVGIIGGTFNPIHLAHLRIAEEVRDTFGLDQVLFIPAASPPHKLMAGELPFELRCALVRMAIADNPGFAVSTVEGEREGKSYSIDTLRTLHARHPADDFFFVIGSDSFLEIGTWHEYAAIFSTTNLVVVERPGAKVEDPSSALPVGVRDDFTLNRSEGRLDHCSGHSVYFLGECLLGISSTRIRHLARQGRSIRYLVPDSVERYIKEQGLYADER